MNMTGCWLSGNLFQWMGSQLVVAAAGHPELGLAFVCEM
jgi:hypothetical protein